MTRHVLTRITAWLFLALFIAACGKASPIEHHEGTSVYTQIGMWVEGNAHNTTNYSQGMYIPINTRVDIQDSNADAIVFYIPDRDLRVRLVNARQYTQLDISGIFDRYFGPDEVNLSGFDRSTRQAIERGEVNRGMSKDAVILSRGYPPAHETPSTDHDKWTYWRHRFGRQIVHFENGQVSKIE